MNDWLLTSEPRPVQLEAIRRSYPKVGYAYFLEMRLGKTQALLNEFLLFRRDYNIQRLFIIAPNKYKYGWQTEAKEFGFPLPMHVFESNKRAEAERFAGQAMVTNYESFVSDENLKIFQKFRPDMIVFDESILAKNRKTYAFKRGLALAANAKVVRILTGKPVTQGPQDLWSQLRLIRQLDNFNFYAFRNTFCKMGGFMGKQVIGVQEVNMPMLQKILADCAFVAKRKDWGTSFDSDYEIRPVEILPQQALHYREMEQEFITYLKSGQPITADQVLTKHIKLQQISSGFLIDEYKKVNDIVPVQELPKFKDLRDSLENEVSGKALVICYYVNSLEKLLHQLKDFQPALIGGNLMMKRLGRDVESEKRRFNHDPKCKVLLGQIQAVKYGHNLMGSKELPCGEIFYYENTYSLDDRSQSEQRPQGEGQVEAIHIVDYATTKVERMIIKALQKKENVSCAIMNAY